MPMRGEEHSFLLEHDLSIGIWRESSRQNYLIVKSVAVVGAMGVAAPSLMSIVACAVPAPKLPPSLSMQRGTAAIPTEQATSKQDPLAY